MRFFKDDIFLKSLVRHKIIKNSDEIELFLANYSGEKKEILKKKLAEILSVATEEMDILLLKELLEDKISLLEIDMSMDELEALYIAMSKRVLKQLSKIIGKNISFSFDSIDKEAINSMRKGFYWMGKEYNESLQIRLKEKIEKIFTGEIDLNDIPKVLKDEFGSIIDADERYFKGVSDHIALQSANVARVTTGEKYGVEYYKVVAMMDSKTSEICRSMNGRIIPAKHLEKQAGNLLNAKSMADKKNAATWQSKAYNGKSDKLASNFGLPPYHFRCRTEVVPVWIDEEEIDGVKMKNTSPLRDDEVIKHIDKMGVERVLSKKNYETGSHSSFLKDRFSKTDVIKALNSITKTAPNNTIKNYTNAISQNGFFMVFDGNDIVTMFKPNRNINSYFKDKSVTLEAEIIKRWWI